MYLDVQFYKIHQPLAQMAIVTCTNGPVRWSEGSRGQKVLLNSSIPWPHLLIADVPSAWHLTCSEYTRIMLYKSKF